MSQQFMVSVCLTESELSLLLPKWKQRHGTDIPSIEQLAQFAATLGAGSLLDFLGFSDCTVSQEVAEEAHFGETEVNTETDAMIDRILDAGDFFTLLQAECKAAIEEAAANVVDGDACSRCRGSGIMVDEDEYDDGLCPFCCGNEYRRDDPPDDY